MLLVKNEIKESLGLDKSFFTSFFSILLLHFACINDKFLLAGRFKFFSQAFLHDTSFQIFSFIFHTTNHKVKYFLSSSYRRIENMGEQLKVRISTVELIQKEFGHDIQEMKR